MGRSSGTCSGGQASLQDAVKRTVVSTGNVSLERAERPQKPCYGGDSRKEVPLRPLSQAALYRGRDAATVRPPVRTSTSFCGFRRGNPPAPGQERVLLISERLPLHVRMVTSLPSLCGSVRSGFTDPGRALRSSRLTRCQWRSGRFLPIRIHFFPGSGHFLPGR
jgi:hypothetical protein